MNDPAPRPLERRVIFLSLRAFALRDCSVGWFSPPLVPSASSAARSRGTILFLPVSRYSWLSLSLPLTVYHHIYHRITTRITREVELSSPSGPPCTLAKLYAARAETDFACELRRNQWRQHDRRGTTDTKVPREVSALRTPLAREKPITDGGAHAKASHACMYTRCARPRAGVYAYIAKHCTKREREGGI